MKRLELLNAILAEWLNVKLAGRAALLLTSRLAFMFNVELTGRTAFRLFCWFIEVDLARIAALVL